jgi:hypothetical protein
MTNNHAVTIPSANNKPDPTGTLTNSGQPGPSPINLLQCSYPCTVQGHSDTVQLLWDGTYFSLPSSEVSDPTFGTVSFTYNPPLQ